MYLTKTYTDEDIEKEYLKAISLNPRDYRSYNTLSFLESKTSEQKINLLKTALKINPYMEAGYFNLSF